MMFEDASENNSRVKVVYDKNYKQHVLLINFELGMWNLRLYISFNFNICKTIFVFI